MGCEQNRLPVALQRIHKVTLTVTWNNNNTGSDQDLPGYVNEGRHGVGGTLTTVLSNLRDVDTGDYLVHGDARLEVRDLVFPSLDFKTEAAADQASSDNVLNFAAATQTVSIRYMDRNAPRGEQAATFLDGTFVGSTTDGPLAVIGRYGFTTGFGRVLNASDSNPLNGAFGADRP